MTESIEHISIAIWMDPITRLLSETLISEAQNYSLSTQVLNPRDALSALDNGIVDVALLPSTTVVSALDRLDVLPTVGISTLFNPYSVLSIDNLGDLDTIDLTVEPDREVQGIVAEIILKEQYNCLANVVSSSDSSNEGGVRIGQGIEEADHGFQLDLGREWYELVNYPFVWALFATRRDGASRKIIQIVRDTVFQIEAERKKWMDRVDLSETEQIFYAESIRYRLDDLAVASLTEFCEYMFYYGHVSEIPQLVLASYSDSTDS